MIPPVDISTIEDPQLRELALRIDHSQRGLKIIEEGQDGRQVQVTAILPAHTDGLITFKEIAASQVGVLNPQWLWEKIVVSSFQEIPITCSDLSTRIAWHRADTEGDQNGKLSKREWQVYLPAESVEDTEWFQMCAHVYNDDGFKRNGEEIGMLAMAMGAGAYILSETVKIRTFRVTVAAVAILSAVLLEYSNPQPSPQLLDRMTNVAGAAIGSVLATYAALYATLYVAKIMIRTWKLEVSTLNDKVAIGIMSGAVGGVPTAGIVGLAWYAGMPHLVDSYWQRKKKGTV